MRFPKSPLAAILLAGVISFSACQHKEKTSNLPIKRYELHGRVVSVDPQTHAAVINGQKIDGWMGAMTMNYKVDNPSIFDRVKPGDEIMATVYDGDYSLHQVKIMGRTTENAKSKK